MQTALTSWLNCEVKQKKEWRQDATNQLAITVRRQES